MALFQNDWGTTIWVTGTIVRDTNIEPELLLQNLLARGVNESLANKAITEFVRTANNQTLSLYDLTNKLMTNWYGVK